MKEVFMNAVEAFVTNNLVNIKKFAGWFAKSTTMNIINDNKKELQELYTDAAYMRSDIEFTEPIKMTKDYYLGYCSAYENLARKLLGEENNQENIEIVIEQLPKLRLKKIISFLGQRGYAQQKELAEHIGVTPSHLWNILNNSSIKELDILSVRKLGKHAIYGLNKRGKKYYQDKVDQDKKQYSKKQFFDLISLVMNNYQTSEIKEITEKAKVIDEDLVKGFYESLNEFNLRNELSRKVQPEYGIEYKNIIQQEIIKMKSKVSANYQPISQFVGQGSDTRKVEHIAA